MVLFNSQVSAESGHSLNIPLPQYAFSETCNFNTLIDSNQFLFRVYTPRMVGGIRSDLANQRDLGLVAPKFRNMEDSIYSLSMEPTPVWTYADAAKHFGKGAHKTSPYVSTSFSFMWTIWEALRRYHEDETKDFEIAVIDAKAVKDRAITSIQLLLESDPSERNGNHWDWCLSCHQSQCVFIYGYIPAHSVMSSISLHSIFSKLPSYLIRPSYPEVTREPHLDTLSKGSNSLTNFAWDFDMRNRTYPNFCYDMTARFNSLEPNARMKDTIIGSLRLSVAFLRPWFRTCHLDPSHLDARADGNCSGEYSRPMLLFEKIFSLTSAIAQWPDQGMWWCGHTEVPVLVRTISATVVEEITDVRSKHFMPVMNTQGEGSSIPVAIPNSPSAPERLISDIESNTELVSILPIALPNPAATNSLPHSHSRLPTPTPTTPPNTPVSMRSRSFDIRSPSASQVPESMAAPFSGRLPFPTWQLPEQIPFSLPSDCISQSDSDGNAESQPHLIHAPKHSAGKSTNTDLESDKKFSQMETDPNTGNHSCPPNSTDSRLSGVIGAASSLATGVLMTALTLYVLFRRRE